MSYTEVISYYLENDPFKKDLSSLNRVSLVSVSQIIELQPDDVLYTSKTMANHIYFLTHGSLTLQTADTKIVTINPGEYLGEESVLGLQSYISKAVAKQTCLLVKIEAQDFQKVHEGSYLSYKDLVAAYSKKFIDQQVVGSKNIRSSSICSPRSSFLSEEVCWILSVIISLFFYILFKDSFIEQNTRLFLTFSVASFCLWAFSLTPSYIAPLVVTVSCLILGCAPKTMVFSGFSSEIFLMVFSSLALGNAMIQSSLLDRMMLKILKFMPPTHFWINASVCIMGIFLTPFIPLSHQRQKVFKRFSKDFTTQLSLSATGSTATKIALSAYTGSTLFGPIFLTSSIYNFLIFSLLPTHQSEFFWFEWFASVLPTGIFLLVFFSVGLHVFFRESEKPTPFRERIETQLKVLGKLRGQEQGLCFLVVGYLVALLSRNYHHIDDAYVSILMFIILIIFGLISPENLKKSLNWPALFLFAFLVGVIKSFYSLELPLNFFPFAGCLGHVIKNDFTLFVFMLGLSLISIRVFLSYGLTVVIAAAILLPFAQEQGVSPWLVGFLILLFSKDSVIPTPSSHVNSFMAEFSSGVNGQTFLLWKYHLMINIIKFAAVYSSISFWKDMNLF